MISNEEMVWVVNLLYVGIGLGSIVPFLLMDRIGRKGTLLIATIPKTASWILVGMAATIPQLYVGRILAGVGCGIAYAVMPMYLGEVSSKRTRGPLGTFAFCGISFLWTALDPSGNSYRHQNLFVANVKILSTQFWKAFLIPVQAEWHVMSLMLNLTGRRLILKWAKLSKN